MLLTKHYLKAGIKKLLYEVELAPSLHVFAGHFALQKRAREKQFEEVKQLLRHKQKIILCGDFNIFKGFDELNDLIHHYDMKIINTETDGTFPAHNPTKCVDLFICSKDITITNFRVLSDIQASDHLPIVVEISI